MGENLNSAGSVSQYKHTEVRTKAMVNSLSSSKGRGNDKTKACFSYKCVRANRFAGRCKTSAQ